MSEFNRFFVNSDDLDANGVVQLASSINMKQMRVERFTYYNTAYNVKGKIILFQESTALSLGFPVSVPLTDGYYDVAAFIAHLKTVLDANSTFGFTYTVSIDAVTSKITIAIDTADPADRVQLTFTDSENDVRQLLGFKTDTTPFAHSITSPNVPQAQPLCIYLLSNLGDYSLSKPYHSYNTSMINNSILQVLDIDSAYGSIVKFVNTMPEYYEVDSKHRFNHLWFRLADQNGNTIDLEGSQWRLELGYLV